MWTTERNVRAVAIMISMPDEERQTHPDIPRPTATRFSLTLEETARLFEEAGLPRNMRSLQRYCAGGRLDCIKEETATGLAYFVDPASVARAITQLAQLHGITDEVRHATAEHDASHSVAPAVEPHPTIAQPRPTAAEHDTDAPEIMETPTPPQPDMSRSVATATDARYVARLESEVEFLREQVVTKDGQIKELTERSRETNVLIGGLQRLLAPLLGSGDPHSTTTRFEDRQQ
jgi:hypothetical protein